MFREHLLTDQFLSKLVVIRVYSITTPERVTLLMDQNFTNWRLHDSTDKTYGTCPVPWLDEHADFQTQCLLTLYLNLFFEITYECNFEIHFPWKTITSIFTESKSKRSMNISKANYIDLLNVSRKSLVLFDRILVEKVEGFYVNIIESWYPLFFYNIDTVLIVSWSSCWGVPYFCCNFYMGKNMGYLLKHPSLKINNQSELYYM